MFRLITDNPSKTNNTCSSEVAQRGVVLNKMPLALGAGNEGSWGGKTGCETVLKPPQKPFILGTHIRTILQHYYSGKVQASWSGFPAHSESGLIFIMIDISIWLLLIDEKK